MKMSSQRGNTERTRPQKFQNKRAFKNDLYDTSRATKELNSLDVSQVCQQCKDVIEWKIRYKKYKALTQPKTCLNCHTKSVKMAYHVLCENCSKVLEVCPKCRQKKELILPKTSSMTKVKFLADMESEIKALPERKRRAFYRYVDKMYGAKRKTRKQNSIKEGEEEKTKATNEDGNMDAEAANWNDIERARKKLEKLGQCLLEDAEDEFDSEELSGDECDDERRPNPLPRKYY